MMSRHEQRVTPKRVEKRERERETEREKKDNCARKLENIVLFIDYTMV